MRLGVCPSSPLFQCGLFYLLLNVRSLFHHIVFVISFVSFYIVNGTVCSDWWVKCVCAHVAACLKAHPFKFVIVVVIYGIRVGQ